ncbi:hypothetical protein M419DRAFT_120881 [Trichoderma reesei RUT C-30]|jgi:hypothetical protein|uniref:Uncharacterized protein n=1 Tax=Hypocrea jecorina (strain ATCC 56765 / BCRC 32924 / NRRL 11460 / Rut C-30) TaxID=1344414 RepID=A0A024RXJ9_HYPJR|nr:hypothetical protein M419DRAFT_120881 [Trichoderma reesei RUT C-30]
MTKTDVAAIPYPTLKCAQSGGYERTRNHDGNDNKNTNWQHAEILPKEKRECPFLVLSVPTSPSARENQFVVVPLLGGCNVTTAKEEERKERKRIVEKTQTCMPPRRQR